MIKLKDLELPELLYIISCPYYWDLTNRVIEIKEEKNYQDIIYISKVLSFPHLNFIRFGGLQISKSSLQQIRHIDYYKALKLQSFT